MEARLTLAWVQGWSAKDETSMARTTCSRVSSWRPFRETRGWGVTASVLPVSSGPEDRGPSWDGPLP